MTVQFLRELIETNARVILPEFGAFLVKDDGTNIFKADNVTFSPFLRYNDGMVEDALSSKMSLSKDESSKQIKQFVESIKDQLLNTDKFAIEGLGFLYRDNRGGVHFSTKAIEKAENKPAQKGKATPKTKAEESKPDEKAPESKPIEDKAKETKAEEPAKIEEAVKPIEEKKEVAKPAEKTPAKKPVHKPTPPPKPKEKIVTAKAKTSDAGETGTGKAILIGSLIGLCVVILLAGGWYLIKNDYFKSLKSKKQVSEQIASEPSDKNIEDIEGVVDEVPEHKGEFDSEFSRMSQEMDKEPTKDVAQKDDVPETKPTEPATKISTEELPKDIIPTSDGPFHLIVGSFRNPEYAEKFSADMKRSGYSSTIVIQESGMHAVTLGSYSTRQDAVRAMDQFKSQHPNVWILTQ